MKHEVAFRREPQPVAGNLFKRAVTTRTLASLWRKSVAEVAEMLWPNDRALADMLTRATSNPAQTGVAGWAAELAQRKTSETLDAIGAASSAADVMKAALVLDWDGAGSISAPGFVASAANSGFVAEGAPIPVRALASTAALLLPYKLATIAVLSREMAESGNAETLISDALVQATALALDAAFFDANAATTARPAGIRNGIATLTASNNADLFSAFAEDISGLFNAVGLVGGKGPFIFVGNIGRITTIRMHYQSENAQNVTLVASSAVGNDLLVIAPRALVAALSADPDVETASAATLVMDTVPGAAGTAGPEREMFQSESLAVKVRWPVSWALRDTRAVAWLTPAWK